MGNISKLRDAADLLLEKGRYEEAYDVYDEVNSQIWCAIGSAQSAISDFSFGYLTHNVRSAVEFRTGMLQPALNTTFLKWFDLDIDQTLNELIFTSFGYLKCLSVSRPLLSRTNSHFVLSGFLTLYSLIIYGTDEKWITQITRIFTPLSDGVKLKKIRPNLPETTVNRMLLQSIEKIKTTDWEGLNGVLLDYLNNAGENETEFFDMASEAADMKDGRYRYKGRQKNYQKQDKKERREAYESYEKYERYEKYEKYESEENSDGSEGSERNEQQQQQSSGSGKGSGHGGSNYRSHGSGSSGNSGPGNSGPGNSSGRGSSGSAFDLSSATDEQKARYYGKILGLEGRVTRSDIRKKYLEAISKYHPDRVQNLGDELIELAEHKTKEINAAYEWLRIKYNL